MGVGVVELLCLARWCLEICVHGRRPKKLTPVPESLDFLLEGSDCWSKQMMHFHRCPKVIISELLGSFGDNELSFVLNGLWTCLVIFSHPCANFANAVEVQSALMERGFGCIRKHYWIQGFQVSTPQYLVKIWGNDSLQRMEFAYQPVTCWHLWLSF